MNRYGEYGNDAPAHFLVFFLISEIILYKDKIKQSEFINHLILTLFIIQSKSILIVAVLLNLINLKKINLKYVVKEKKFFFLMFFFIIWILKNILTSGCAIYPLKFTCFKNLSWVDINKVENVSKSSEAWTKGWSNLKTEDKDKFIKMDDFLENFSWLNAWSEKHLKYTLALQIPYVSFCIIILILMKFKSKTVNLKNERDYYFLIIGLLICSIIWFIKAPLYRYGYSFLVSLISSSLALSAIKSNLNPKKTYILCNFIIIIGISIIVSKNIIRIFNNDNNYNNYPWPKYYSMGEDNLMTDFIEKKLGYKTILIPKNGYCMYAKNICNHYNLDKNLDIKSLKGYDIIYFNYK